MGAALYLSPLTPSNTAHHINVHYTMSDEVPKSSVVQSAEASSSSSTTTVIDSAQIPKAPSPSAPALSTKAEAGEQKAQSTTTPTVVSGGGNGMNKDDLDSDEFEDEDDDEDEYTDDDDDEDGPGLSYLLQDVSSVTRDQGSKGESYHREPLPRPRTFLLLRYSFHMTGWRG